MRLLSLLIILLCSVTLHHSQIYISEINFIDDEYLEIYSDEKIDFSNFTIHDDNGLSKNNTLTLIQNSSSNVYLFAGSSFINSNNLSNFNCTIYQTSGSQLSNGGLKQDGENIFLIDKTTNFFWNKTETLLFEQNQSLHFDNDTPFISSQSICSLSIPLVNQDNSTYPSTPQNNTNNTNSSNSTSQTSMCNNTFSISIQPREITQKIEFDFHVNTLNNISIEYWVENYEQEILKNNLETQNTNTKSYTPTHTNPIVIQAILKQNNCTYSANKETFFYKYIEDDEEIVSADEEIQELISYVTLLTRQEQNGFLELSFELYRGDTAKRTFYITNNNKQQHSIEIPNKYTKIKSKLRINLDNGENKILFSGIDILHELEHFYEHEENQPLEDILNNDLPDIQFFAITQLGEDISKSFMTLKEIQIICNMYQKNTKVSNEVSKIFESGFYTINHIINTSKLRVEENQSNIELKQTCKYKSPNLKSYKYETSYFNYSFLKEVNQESLNVEFSSFEKNRTFEISEKETEISYYSTQKTLREKANLPIMGAMSALLIGFLVLW
jgi:hypothetical protein